MVTVTIILGLFLISIFFLRRRYQYWTSKGVYQIQPTWILGNIGQIVLGKKSMGEAVTIWYNELKEKDLKYGGAYMFLSPTFVAISPDLIKDIMNTSFANFNSHGDFANGEIDPLSEHLFNIDGPKWKILRAKLTPTFTSGKMKMMFNTIQSCTSGLNEMLSEYSRSGEAVNIKDILGRFTTDVIGSCAFGIDCNSIKNPDTEFRIYGKRAVETTTLEAIKIMCIFAFPKAIKTFLGLKIVQSDIERFFFKVVTDTVKYREENNIVRNDFMHLLLQLKNKGKITDDDDFKGQNGNLGKSVLNMNELTAQAFLFFIAGFETSSTAMTYTSYELARDQNVQTKLRQEIKEVLKMHNGEVTYEAVKEMKYLDQVLNEALRMHPPIVAIPRKCTKEYNLPGTDVIIEKGTIVQIPVQGLQMDPNYFEDPEKFNPERFSDKNKWKIKPYTYLPFGEGPRVCIGLRFGVLQAKLGLISLLRNYKITINNKTKLPLQMDPASLFIKSVKEGLWINVANA